MLSFRVWKFPRYFAFLEGCKNAKACTVLLRGGSKDILNEVERNLADAMQVSFCPPLPRDGQPSFSVRIHVSVRVLSFPRGASSLRRGSVELDFGSVPIPHNAPSHGVL